MKQLTLRFSRSLLALLLALPMTAAAEEPDFQSQVKAAFLFNFAKFVNWPAAKFADALAPLEICVLESEPLSAVLEATLRGKSVDQHPLAVRRSARVEDLRSCHLFYTSVQDAVALNTSFAKLAGSAVMTVHESAQTLPGGVARFFIDGRKLRFEINGAAAERENLQLSARLQNVAVVVRQ